jgi:uncharacterized RDD family membrane protein YckC
MLFNDQGISYCSECGEVLFPSITHITYANGSRLIIARWNTRFWAYTIDASIVAIFYYLLESIFVFNNIYGLSIGEPLYRLWLFTLGSFSLLFFLYTTALEYYYGQTLGKFLLKLEVVSKTTGDRPPIRDIVISALGRAFFVPLDLIFGVVLHRNHQTPDLKQRFMQKLSHTLIIHQPIKGIAQV